MTTKVQNSVIFPKPRVAEISYTLTILYLHEIQLAQDGGLVGAKASYREHVLAYSNHSFMTRGGPEALAQGWPTYGACANNDALHDTPLIIEEKTCLLVKK